MPYKKTIAAFLLTLLVVVGSIFYFRHQVYYSHSSVSAQKMFEIKKGEGNAEIAARLRKEGLISGKYYFYYYVRKHNLLSKIMPGEYQLSGTMTIPEIATVITTAQEQFVKVTFPEGFTAVQMAARLTANDLPGDEFLKIVKNPGELKKRYSYLTPATVTTLEGYLFPDTYFFKKDISAKDIVGRLLDTFDKNLTAQMVSDAAIDKTTNDIVIMASIVQKEVRDAADMKTVAGIFWKRIAEQQRLQSDATLSYILNDKVDQHNAKELATDSPYNSYMYAGLPPTPISNPGVDALAAAVYPTASDYNYFLTATVNGETSVVFSATYEEHVAAKQKYGL